MKVNDPTPKSFLDHLEDLRWVLIKGAGAFAVCFALCIFYTRPLLHFLYQPLRHAGQDPQVMLRVLGILDPLSIQIDLGLMGGLVLSLPFLLYFTAQFVLPALTQREARALLPAFAAGTFLFAGGVAFCFYWILPQTLRWAFSLGAWEGFRTEWTVQNYIDFVLQMLLAFGVSFELPLVLILLNVLGIVRAATLKNFRRHTFVLLVILACCVVPATDPFSLGMLIVPMYALFELTLLVTSFLERRREAEEPWPNEPQ